MRAEGVDVAYALVLGLFHKGKRNPEIPCRGANVPAASFHQAKLLQRPEAAATDRQAGKLRAILRVRTLVTDETRRKGFVGFVG